jgi:hypothetical protein
MANWMLEMEKDISQVLTITFSRWYIAVKEYK